VYIGEVHLTGKMIDLETKTAMVHGHFEKEPTPLAPGTFMQATLFTEGKEVWTVPESAVVRQGGEVFIFIKNKDGFEKIAVATGMSGNGYVEIIGMDFSENKQVALSGAYYLNGSDGEIESGHSH
jgi:cobalt-zinc-cadmium efflux system membrane fusion protein